MLQQYILTYKIFYFLFSNRWTEFYRSMFWLAVIYGGLMVLHIFLLIVLKFGKRNSEKHRMHGALTFPRFEIFLIFLALPNICKSSAVLFQGNHNHNVIICHLTIFCDQ